MALVVSVLPPGLAAQVADSTRTHVVKRGDTLWDLARVYLGDPFLWPRIFEANRAAVRNPDLIFPAERLMIPGSTVGDAGLATSPPITPQTSEADTVRGSGGNSVRPEAVSGAAADAPPTVASAGADDAGAAFYSASWLSDPKALALVGKIRSLADPAAAKDILVSHLYPFTRYVVSIAEGGGGVAAGDSLLVVHLGRQVRGHGVIVEPVGFLRVEEVGGDLITAMMIRQFGAGVVGDAVMALPSPQVPDSAAAGVERAGVGRIVAFRVDQPIYGVGDEAYIVPGADAGLEVGTELAVVAPSAGGAAAPAQRVATLRVVRVDARTATVRVVSQTSTALREGMAVRVVAAGR